MKSLFICVFLFAVSAVFGTIPHAYVTDLGGTSISVINSGNNTVQKIFGFTKPHVIQVTADGTAAYVGDETAQILKINCLDHTVTSIGTISGHAVAMAILPDASFLYTANHNNTVSIIDLSNDTIVGELTGFGSPQDIAVTPDNAFLYVTNKAVGTITIISTATNEVVHTITGLVNPVGITFNIDGSYAYVTDKAHNSVYVIRISDNTIFDIIYGFNKPGFVAVSPDKAYAYVTNAGNDSVSIVRLSDNFIAQTLLVPLPNSIAVSSDGLFLFVGSDFGDVFKLATLDGSIQTAIPGFQCPSNIAFSTNNAPADTVNGWQVKSKSNPLQLYNQISWLEPAGFPIGYRIYRDSLYSELVASIAGGGVLLYNDMQRQIGQTYSYYVIADYPNSYSSSIGSVEVTPARVGLPQLR